MTLPKYVYAIMIGIGLVTAVALASFAPFLLGWVSLLFPILLLMMLWDIMGGLEKIWSKLGDIEQRLEA